MRTAILALIFAIPVSLTADLIGVAFGAVDSAEPPCVAPIAAEPMVMPPQAGTEEPVKRPSRRWMRTA